MKPFYFIIGVLSDLKNRFSNEFEDKLKLVRPSKYYVIKFEVIDYGLGPDRLTMAISMAGYKLRRMSIDDIKQYIIDERIKHQPQMGFGGLVDIKEEYHGPWFRQPNIDRRHGNCVKYKLSDELEVVWEKTNNSEDSDDITIKFQHSSPEHAGVTVFGTEGAYELKEILEQYIEENKHLPTINYH